MDKPTIAIETPAFAECEKHGELTAQQVVRIFSFAGNDSPPFCAQCFSEWVGKQFPVTLKVH